MEKKFHFIVVPCCPMSQKPRDVDKKTPSWVFCCVDRAGYFWGSWVSNAYPNAPSTIPTVAPYKRFSSFLPCFFSVLLLHSGHTSKQQVFHCFSIVSRMLYAVNFTNNGPTSEPQFYLASFYPLPILSTVSIAFQFFFHCFMSKSLLFSIVVLIIFPSFPIFFPLLSVIFPHFFYCFSHHFPLHCQHPIYPYFPPYFSPRDSSIHFTHILFTQRFFTQKLFLHRLFTQRLFTQKLFVHILFTHILFTHILFTQRLFT